jgi:4-amino-4-deoxy-L-arabinose transferase-like glycosyltransferase
VAFSRAEGIFHPYYVSQIAPLIAALVGATAWVVLRGGTSARVVGAAAVAAGVIAEIAILNDNPGSLDWWKPLLAAGGVAAAAGLAMAVTRRARTIAATAAISLLLLAPAAWSAQTLGHATSGTFPAGGPTSASFAGGAGGGMGGPPGGTTNGGGFGGGGGGMFGGDTSALTAAIAYANENGGGAIAVASQSGASGSLITSGADVVAIGGFSGRESQVTADWLADRIDSGEIRYVLTSGASGLPNDGRTGADDVMAAVEAVGKTTSVDGLYDLQGRADALRSQ